MATNPLRFRGLFCHAWDLAADGVDPLMAWMADSGLNTLCIAGTYHSGWFLHPSHPSHRTFMTEGSVCYFHPDPSLYTDTRLRPTVSKICADRDWLAEAGHRLDHHGLRMVSWTIGTHNTRLGLAHPALTQQTAYGDRLPHCLCISNDDVRAYLSALCRDLATHYPLDAIQLEATGWLGLAHGHHHERDLVGLTAVERDLMSLCLCPACTRRATAAGVDCRQAAATVRAVLDAAFREAPDRPPGHPTTMAELEEHAPDLRAFNAWRRTYANAVVADIKATALRGTPCRLLLETPYDPDLDSSVDGFACIAYAQTPEQVAATCRTARQAIPADWPGLLQCLIQLGQGIPRDQEQFAQIVHAVRTSGCNGINFYNRSESPPKMLSWLRTALT